MGKKTGTRIPARQTPSLSVPAVWSKIFVLGLSVPVAGTKTKILGLCAPAAGAKTKILGFAPRPPESKQKFGALEML
jgi:hypothetical protein